MCDVVSRLWPIAKTTIIVNFVFSCKINSLAQYSANTIVIVGTGRVAKQLALAFRDKALQIAQVFGRNAEKAKAIATLVDAPFTDSLSLLKKDADVYILAVSDDAIAAVAMQFEHISGLVVHTSGFRSISDFPKAIKRTGIFYPLQTFSENRTLDFSNIPIFIQANNIDDEQLLLNLGQKISVKVVPSNDQQRRHLHLAAVFVSNFSNAMYAIGDELLSESNLDFDHLKPLIVETALKATIMHPLDAQTGPARRNDKSTIAAQLQLLENHPQLASIYNELTQYIQSKFYNKR